MSERGFEKSIRRKLSRTAFLRDKRNEGENRIQSIQIGAEALIRAKHASQKIHTHIRGVSLAIHILLHPQLLKELAQRFLNLFDEREKQSVQNIQNLVDYGRVQQVILFHSQEKAKHQHTPSVGAGALLGILDLLKSLGRIEREGDTSIWIGRVDSVHQAIIWVVDGICSPIDRFPELLCVLLFNMATSTHLLRHRLHYLLKVKAG